MLSNVLYHTDVGISVTQLVSIDEVVQVFQTCVNTALGKTMRWWTHYYKHRICHICS